jgi:hypothetical protein
MLTLWEDASLGPITGNLFVASITPPKTGHEPQTPALPPSVFATALHSASAYLTGRVEGDLTAAPASVAFGAVRQGQSVTQRIVLTPKAATTWQNVHINSGCPWLSARWLATTDPALVTLNKSASQNQILEVMLSPQAPACLMQSQLTLILANGQRLVLPVSATVQAQAAQPWTLWSGSRLVPLLEKAGAKE